MSPAADSSDIDVHRAFVLSSLYNGKVAYGVVEVAYPACGLGFDVFGKRT